MDHNGCIYLVLPGHEMIEDYSATENLLKTMGTSLKELIEMFINTWAEFKSTDLHGWGYQTYRPFHYEEDNASVLELRIQARWLVTDIILENAFKRYEEGQGTKPLMQDLRDAEKIMLSLWATLSENIFELMAEMKVEDSQISYLRFVKWVGNDFIISVPRQRQMLEISRQEGLQQYNCEEAQERKRVEELRKSSPLCNHYPGGGDRFDPSVQH